MAFHRNLPFVTSDKKILDSEGSEYVEILSQFVFTTLTGIVNDILETHFKNLPFDDEGYQVPNEFLGEFIALNFTCKHDKNIGTKSGTVGVIRVAIPEEIYSALFDVFVSQIDDSKVDTEKKKKRI